VRKKVLAVGLSMDEQRKLAMIEKQLSADDPRLCQLILTWPVHGRWAAAARRRWGLAAVGLAVGVGSLAAAAVRAGDWLPPLLVGVGTLACVGALRLARRSPRAAGRGRHRRRLSIRLNSGPPRLGWRW